jgi:hypothetical protein
MTTSRIRELEKLGFEWIASGFNWEDRFSELANYHSIHGHCDVPHRYSGKGKLGFWVATQRRQHKLHSEGKKSFMTTHRIQELESLGFEWDRVNAVSAAWDDRLSELAAFRQIHGHCNVPRRYCEKQSKWVGKQRTQYKLHLEEKTSFMTTHRIQALERLGFE